MLVHPTVTPVFCSLFTLLHSRFCFVTQRSSPSSSLEKKGVAWRHNNRLRRRLRIMTPVLNYTPGLRENIQEKNPLHRVVRGRITHLSIWGFTCLPWHIPAAHTIADKNTGSHVMSILRKQPTLCDANTGFLEERLEKFHAGDESLPRLDSASDQSDTFQIWIVTRHEYGISTLASQTLFRGGGGGGGESRVDVAKCRLFSLFFGYRTTHIHCVTHLPPRAQVEFGLGTDVTPYSSDLTTSHKSSLLQTCTTPTRKDSH